MITKINPKVFRKTKTIFLHIIPDGEHMENPVFQFSMENLPDMLDLLDPVTLD